MQDEWLEEPASQDLVYELTEVEDKGEYTEQRYGNADAYWNGVLVEGRAEGEQKRHVAENCGWRKKINSRVFHNTEQVYQAYDNRHREEGSADQPTAVLEQIRSLNNPASMPMHINSFSDAAAHFNGDMTEVCSITPSESTSVAHLSANQAVSPNLTWNSRLVRILASPSVASSLSSAIRARAYGKSSSAHMNMCEVGMVPNFSYPLANACWSDTCHASRCEKMEEAGTESYP